MTSENRASPLAASMRQFHMKLPMAAQLSPYAWALGSS